MINKILNLIFPPKCIFCSQILEPEMKIEVCSSCYSRIPFLEEMNSTVKEKYKGTYFDEVICVCTYSGIMKSALRRNKFSDKPSYYRAFSNLLVEKIKKVTRDINFDIIINVPMHIEKERARGYNQSFLIAKQLSKEFNKPLMSQILKKIIATENQSHLSKEMRAKNLVGAFQVYGAQEIYGKTILLVDDILTTGSTIEECSRVLKEVGAVRIIAVVIATGRHDVC